MASRVDISPRHFKTLVREALEELPERFQPMLENVAVVIEEEPRAEDLEGLDVDPEEGEL
ncbi:MAG: hypothetical protein IID07_15985, partial [Gemmatimonadetes bacterium]|nr:hypothetical protein [Gemmatimonadota bacterium]